MTTDPSPKLPLWVFVVSDVALLATAWLIAEYSRHPLSPAAVSAVAGCAALGTLVLLVPLLLRYEHQKNEALDERQRSLEGIARTVQESAEQLSIAANGLNQIASLARQSLQTAETLPEKLQAQVTAFETKAANSQESDRARLEKELTALRKTNGEQLAALAAQIVLVTTEWTKLEAASRTHLAQAKESLGQLDQQAATKVASAHAQALTELDARLSALAARTVPASAAVPPPAATATPTTDSTQLIPIESPVVPAASPAVASIEPDHASAPVAAKEDTPTEAVTPTLAAAPKRPRKPRREATPVSTPPEAVTAAPVASPADAAAPESAAVVSPVTVEPAEENTSSAAAVTHAESTPAPVVAIAPAELPAEPAAASPVAAVAPTTSVTPTAPRVTEIVPTEPSPSSTPISEAPADKAEPTPAVAPAETPRRRASRAKPEPESEPMLDLAIDDSAPPARTIERGLSSDGATRMVVTAYIGIGNRLFVRGDGPGLSRDKGVPLQFVSIGKWRWETNDATAPIRFRILKNDTTECTGLGEQSLEPGYQAEFSANF